MCEAGSSVKHKCYVSAGLVRARATERTSYIHTSFQILFSSPAYFTLPCLDASRRASSPIRSHASCAPRHVASRRSAFRRPSIESNFSPRFRFPVFRDLVPLGSPPSDDPRVTRKREASRRTDRPLFSLSPSTFHSRFPRRSRGFATTGRSPVLGAARITWSERGKKEKEEEKKRERERVCMRVCTGE